MKQLARSTQPVDVKVVLGVTKFKPRYAQWLADISLFLTATRYDT